MEAPLTKRNLKEAYERSKKTKAARKGRARAAFDGLECSVRISLASAGNGITVD
jgi:hypothetical protein